MENSFEEMPNYYSILIPEVRYNKDLNDKEKLLYSEITALSNTYGYCFASNKYFSELYDVTPIWISKCINHLKELGFIDIEIIKSKRIIKLKVLNNSLTGIKEKFNTPIKEKFNHNNINNNNINNSNSNSLFEFIESNFGRTLNYIEYELIETWEDTELTRYAIKQAILSNHCNLKYIQSILNTYRKENIQTVQQAQEREEQYKNKKNKPTVSKGWEDDFWNE